jgi:hypothetical protein
MIGQNIAGGSSNFHLLDPVFLTFSEKTPVFFQNRDPSTEAVQERYTKTTTICPRQGDAMAITGSSLAELHNAYQFAFAVIVNRGRFHQIRQILAFCNLRTPKEWDFYRAQKSICTAIIELERESCRDARQRLTDSAIESAQPASLP